MARIEVTQFFDDIDNTQLTDGEVKVVEFSINGVNYVMDLSLENARKFEEALAPYIKVATRVTKSRTASKTRSSAGKSSPERNRAIRQWARDKGLKVSMRGQIASSIVEAYDQAHK